ncbi:hypothetical protein A0H76_1537 [Hepatospora eriocheir]|uniref:Uncharacterized protein n=1 Tax=Hepatospora eriocheir TaxID=1081669 RepID=A0A1X0Q5V8_9MICR|nr:hypothetical protein A0H76_1537 [Hepatospora eriocheir]
MIFLILINNIYNSIKLINTSSDSGVDSDSQKTIIEEPIFIPRKPPIKLKCKKLSFILIAASIFILLIILIHLFINPKKYIQ